MSAEAELATLKEKTENIIRLYDAMDKRITKMEDEQTSMKIDQSSINTKLDNIVEMLTLSKQAKFNWGNLIFGGMMAVIAVFEFIRTIKGV